MNTISNRMNKILLFVLFFYILDSILLFPARTNLIYMMAFILFRAGFLTAAAFVVKLYVIRPLGKTEKKRWMTMFPEESDWNNYVRSAQSPRPVTGFTIFDVNR